MAIPARYCPSCLSSVRNASTLAFRPATAAIFPSQSPFQQAQAKRNASQSATAQKYRRKDKETKAAQSKKKKGRTSFEQPDLKQVKQFSLVDAMRYLKAAEVGRPPTSAKYELHIRLRTPKNGATVRSRLRLPHPVKTDLRICVICPPDSKQGKAALAAGASLVGEESVIEAVKEGRIEFERCLCHTDSLPKLAKSGVARTLGPRGLMPSAKTNTVVKDVAAAVREISGASEYRERLGVLRVGIGQLGFTPEEVQRNIKAFMEKLRKDIAALSDRVSKEVHEVVLSSTHGPGMSLNGEMRSEGSLDTKDLSVVN